MRKSLLACLACLAVGAAAGACGVRLVDSRRPTAPPPAPAEPAPAEEADPVVAAIDTDAFFGTVMGEEGKKGPHSTAGVGGAGYRLGEAVWDADPVAEEELRARADAALKGPVRAAGARPQEQGVSAGVIRTGTHRLYTFVCFYDATIGGRTRNRQATLWVTVPADGRQHSACFRYGG